jgi:uncharacterized membrane protein YdjX (TVP38/TMEM64 family)
MIVAALSPFPAELVAATNGVIFGQVVGFALTWVGALIGATIGFVVARGFGQKPIVHLIGKNRMKTFAGWSNRYGAIMFLVARLLPIVPFFVLNYGAGLTKIGFGRYFVLTAIGIIPMTALCVILGDRVRGLDWQAIYMISILIVLATAAAIWLRHRQTCRIVTNPKIPGSQTLKEVNRLRSHDPEG